MDEQVFEASKREKRRREVIKQNLLPKVIRSCYKGLDVLSKEHSLSFRREKEEEGHSTRSLTYGEVVVESFVTILHLARKLQIKWMKGATTSFDIEQGAFYDLGCGTAKPVLIAALLGGFASCCGIEIVPGLVTSGNIAHKNLSTLLRLDKGQGLIDDEDDAPPLLTVFAGLSLAVAPRPTSTPSPITNAPGERNADAVARDTVVSAALRHVKIQAATFIGANDLSNWLVKTVGKKVYKQAMSGTSTFRKFITLRAEGQLVFNADTNTVSVAAAAAPSEIETEVDRTGAGAEGGAETPVQAEAVRSAPPAGQRELVLSPEECQVFLPLPIIDIHVGDIFEESAGDAMPRWWDTATTVYAASLLFGDAEMARLLERCTAMHLGSIIITLKSFPEYHEKTLKEERGLKRLELVEEGFFRFSWAMAKVFFYVVVAG